MTTSKQAAAWFTPKRQRSQYTCMATSLSMALESCGIVVDEDTVNKVMGAAPMQGASWEQAFAASQHFGARVTFICPATLAQVKEYTDRGVAVMIAWNPEGRPWSHASVIKDVDDDGNVTVADPNIPDPDVTNRTLPKAEFYGKWYEKWESYLVRRPAMAVEREISPEGRQMVASYQKKASMLRHCLFYKAVNGKWYMELADNEYDERDEATTYGPFGSERQAFDFLDKFSNPGSISTDNSGREKVPTRSPNGDPVVDPLSHRRLWRSEKEITMNSMIARVASRHIESFQFALAQAFSDQVGMPERMTLAQLTKLLEQAFIDMVTELDWASNGLELGRMTSIELAYGPFKDYGWENGPPEQAESSFEIPESASGTYTAKATIKNLAYSLMHMRTPTTFFKHKGREILAFLASPRNRVMLEKFLLSLPLSKVLDDVPFTDIDSDALNDLFIENVESGVNGVAGATQSVGDVEWEFDGNSLNFTVWVTFPYDDTSDLGAEAPEPDYDDRRDDRDYDW